MKNVPRRWCIYHADFRSLLHNNFKWKNFHWSSAFSKFPQTRSMLCVSVSNTPPTTLVSRDRFRSDRQVCSSLMGRINQNIRKEGKHCTKSIVHLIALRKINVNGTKKVQLNRKAFAPQKEKKTEQNVVNEPSSHVLASPRRLYNSRKVFRYKRIPEGRYLYVVRRSLKSWKITALMSLFVPIIMQHTAISRDIYLCTTYTRIRMLSFLRFTRII